MKILGIDDNEDINKLLQSVAKSEGHEFIQVNNGVAGLEKIRNENFDVVLLDIAMPDFSGRDVVDALAKDGMVKKQPIILFTASSITDDEINEMIAMGVHSCIRKPAPLDTILGTLEKIVSDAKN